MEMLSQIGMLILSLFVLVKGSDWFVAAAEKIGLRAGISPFVIGVTVVAFGTSLPELAASIKAVLSGHSEIVSNVVIGSNVANILLVLGTVSLVSKVVKMDYNIMDIDMPLLVGSSIFLWFVSKDGSIDEVEAILFLICLVIFLLNSLSSSEDRAVDKTPLKWTVFAMLIVGGLMVKFGADFTVTSIGALSNTLHLDQGVIAATLVALGTSLPEVVVSITAAMKGNPAMAVGNVLGSNIFNTYAVISIPSFFGEVLIPEEMLDFNLPFMIAVSVLFALISIGGRITRWEGSMLLAFYVYFIYHSFIN